MVKNPKNKKDKKKNDNVHKLNKIYAIIYYDNNKHPDIIDITKYTDYFHHKNRTYFILYDEVMKLKLKRWFVKNEMYLFYFYDNQNPITITPDLSLSTKIIPNKMIHTIIKSDALSKVEKARNTFDLSNVDPRMLIGLGVVLVVAYYFLSGGSIT